MSRMSEYKKDSFFQNYINDKLQKYFIQNVAISRYYIYYNNYYQYESIIISKLFQ